jgi:hypothetical protein
MSLFRKLFLIVAAIFRGRGGSRRDEPVDEKWYDEIIEEGVNPKLPGLYEWRIEGVGCYIGQYTRVSRPRRQYERNVLRLLAGLFYRPSDPNGFRRIHRALAEARKARHVVTLTLLENQGTKENRNRRERELIKERQAQAKLGGLLVLNSTPSR